MSKPLVGNDRLSSGGLGVLRSRDNENDLVGQVVEVLCSDALILGHKRKTDEVVVLVLKHRIGEDEEILLAKDAIAGCDLPGTCHP